MFWAKFRALLERKPLTYDLLFRRWFSFCLFFHYLT